MKNDILSKLKAQSFKSTGFIFVGLFALVVSFAAGVQVGLHKAKFSNAFGKNYERNMVGMRDLPRGGDKMPGGEGRPMAPGMFGDKGGRNGHGVAGEVLSISGDSLVVKGIDNQESAIKVTETTIINQGPDTIELGDLQVGDRIVVVGKPGEDGVIGAHLIRVLPADMPTPRN